MQPYVHKKGHISKMLQIFAVDILLAACQSKYTITIQKLTKCVPYLDKQIFNAHGNDD